MPVALSEFDYLASFLQFLQRGLNMNLRLKEVILRHRALNIAPGTLKGVNKKK